MAEQNLPHDNVQIVELQPLEDFAKVGKAKLLDFEKSLLGGAGVGAAEGPAAGNVGNRH